MLSKRENYLIAAYGGKGEYVPSFFEDSIGFFPPFWAADPLSGVDMFNTRWVSNDAGMMPDERYPAMASIADWRKTAKLPDVASLPWEEWLAGYEAAAAGSEKARIAMLNTSGLFLIPVNMLGWVEALSAIYEEPEELSAFVHALTDFLVSLVPYLAKAQPDIISTGDDVASSTGPFFSKEVWDSLYGPCFRRIIDAIHSVGALAEFHCCGSCDWLIDEFLEIGVDICQLPQINEQLLASKKKYGRHLVMTGGWDRHGEGALPGAPEEAVRASVREAIDTYGAEGALIFWDGGITGTSQDSQNKMAWVASELALYGGRPE